MSHYIPNDFDGGDDSDIYGSMIMRGIVDGGYESFLGGLGITETDSDSESSSSDESVSTVDADKDKKPLTKQLSIDPDNVNEEPVLDPTNDEQITNILNMDEEDSEADEEAEFGIENANEEDSDAEEPTDANEEDSYAGKLDANEEDSDAGKLDANEDAEPEFGIEDVEPDTELDANEDAEPEFGIEDVEPDDDAKEPEPKPRKKTTRPDNVEDAVVKKSTTGGAFNFGDALQSYLSDR